MAENDLGAVFARNVRMRRLQNDMTQTDLARRMKELGFSFHQQTIQRIEDDLRPVKLEEAYALARIFHISVDAMAWNFENMRAHEVSEFGNGSLSMIDKIVRGQIDWLTESRGLLFQLDMESKRDHPNTRRWDAGRELVRRLLEEVAWSSAQAERLNETYFRGIYLKFGGREETVDPDVVDENDPGESDPDAWEAEQLAKKLLADGLPPSHYREMPIEDLAEIYIRPDGDRSREILGADFGPEPTEETQGAEIFKRSDLERKTD